MNCVASSYQRIERLTEWDEQLAAIENAAAIVPWSRDNLLSCFSDGYTVYGVKLSGIELVAFIIVQQTIPDEWTIMDIAVHPKVQRQGIGARLVNAITKAADNEQADVLLEVRESNIAAITLYERFGFRHIGLRKNYYPNLDGDREAAIVMRREPQPNHSQ